MSEHVTSETTPIDELLLDDEPEVIGQSAVRAFDTAAARAIDFASQSMMESDPLPEEPEATLVEEEPEVTLVEEEPEESEIGEKRNPVIHIFGRAYDRDSVFVGLLLLALWVFVWRTSGLWKTLRTDLTFTLIFVIFAVYIVANIATSGKTSGGVVYELNILLTVEQMISILFGTIVLFALFGKNIPVHENCRPVIMHISISIIVILTLASLWVNVWTSGRSFRAIRKFKQGIYNVALTLFILVGLIFLRGGACA